MVELRVYFFSTQVKFILNTINMQINFKKILFSKTAELIII